MLYININVLYIYDISLQIHVQKEIEISNLRLFTIKETQIFFGNELSSCYRESEKYLRMSNVV